MQAECICTSPVAAEAGGQDRGETGLYEMGTSNNHVSLPRQLDIVPIMQQGTRFMGSVNGNKQLHGLRPKFFLCNDINHVFTKDWSLDSLFFA